MIQQAIILSLQITGIYILFQQGMLLGWLGIWISNLLDKTIGMKASKYVVKPFFGCLACMASVWTCLLTWQINIGLMLLVCGINVLIDKIVNYEGTPCW